MTFAFFVAGGILGAAWFWWSAYFWCGRALKAEASVKLWQAECGRVINAHADTAHRLDAAEQRITYLAGELTKAYHVLNAMSDEDRSKAVQSAYSARRLH